jgi:arabinan endo-1,5-alpha-L-arabinosidase
VKNRVLLLVALLAVLAPLGVAASDASVARPVKARYTNQLKPHTASGAPVQSCADPSVLRGRGRYARYWYMYCTSDPLRDGATSTRLPMLRSPDLVHWRYVGSALPDKPSWAASRATLWAPDVVYSSTYRRYYLTYAVTDTVDSMSGQPGCDKDPAIGVATSASPTGPWRMVSAPLVRPRRLGLGCSFASTIDPDVLGASIGRSGMLYYGGFRGGIDAQKVSVSKYALRLYGGARQVTIGRRYEGANVVRRGGYYYLFVSSGSCCAGPLSGYAVFAGRSTSAFGPFVDREGVPLTASRTGGTPVLAPNGNRWVGGGHNAVFQDFGGQWWTVYHAIDKSAPFFAARPGFTKRPPMLDPVDWVGGWPMVRSGLGASDASMPAPAAQPHRRTTYRRTSAPYDALGTPNPAGIDEFDGDALDPRWSWVREPADRATYGVSGGTFHLATQAGGLTGEADGASVLTEAAPAGSYAVQTLVRLDVPASGAGYDYVQGGLVIYGSDDRFLKLTHVSAGQTRLTEFGKEVPAAGAGYPRYGGFTVGPPGDLTWLRIVKRVTGGHSYFTAYTSNDGTHFVRGGTWQYDELGTGERIGLVSLGGTGFTSSFDYVHVWSLAS